MLRFDNDCVILNYVIRVWEHLMEKVEDADIQRVRGHLGFNRCSLPICACAPVSKKVLEFFDRCGIEIIELYGTTECGVSVTNTKKNYRLGSVGRPIVGTQVKIMIHSAKSDSGEASVLRYS